MNDTAPQSALREWRDHMAHPVRASALCGIAVILTLVAPFDTDVVMRPLPRLVYWLAVAWLTYGAGYVANGVAVRAAPDRLTLRILIAGPLTGLGVLVIVFMLNGLAFGSSALGQDPLGLIVTVFGVAIIIAAILQIAHAPGPQHPDPHPPALLERVPMEKRGPLVSISVEDHYVRVRTTKGEEMILMRLADAIREVGGTRGLQVHRSHWVALDQITAVTRKGDGALLRMCHGPDIPVSRANLPKLREAGLLPR